MNDIIEHHGVKGQRWGVRKKRVVVKTKALKPMRLKIYSGSN